MLGDLLKRLQLPNYYWSLNQMSLLGLFLQLANLGVKIEIPKARLDPQPNVSWTLPTGSSRISEGSQPGMLTLLAWSQWSSAGWFHSRQVQYHIPRYPWVSSYVGQSVKISHIHYFNTGGYTIKWKLIQINTNQMNSFISFRILSFLASPVLFPQTSWIPIIFRYCASR